MSKKKICLAIGNKSVEDWLIDKLSQYCDFVIALHREQVLDIINKHTPEIVILDVSLPTSQINGISVDLLVNKIKTIYRSCRPILICGNHVPGDEFLTRMVNRGVYDIAYGECVKIQDVCDMIFNPRDYSYASNLQNFEDMTDKDFGIDQAKIIEQRDSFDNSKSHEKQNTYNDYNNVNDSGSYNYNNYQNQNNTADDTSVLTSEMAYSDNKCGIVFRLFDDSQKCYTDSSKSTEVVPYFKEQYQNQKSSYVNFGKIIAFVSARQGVGCTSSAINTAFAFADENKKVLLVDANFGRSCIYQRLGLPESYGYCLEDMLRAFLNGQDIFNMPLSKVQMRNDNGRASLIPDSLYFMRFSDDFNYMDNSIDLTGMINSLRQVFDYIIFDTAIYSYPVISDILSVSSKVILVTLQDIYEVNTACQCLTNYDNMYNSLSGKIIPLINRYIKKGEPQMELIMGALSTTCCICIPDDNYGYMRAYSAGRAYYSLTNKKTRNIYKSIMDLV